MDQAQTPRPRGLRLFTGALDLAGRHCTVCSYLDISESACGHQMQLPDKPPLTPVSDCSYYTAYADPITASVPECTSTLSPPTSPDSVSESDCSISLTLPAIASNDSAKSLQRSPSLRHKKSPAGTSLREIRAAQARLQAKQSEEQLRQMYERQTWSYLNGYFGDLDALEE